MSRLTDALIGALTMSGPQRFLGAAWVPAFVRMAPARSRRSVALNLLALSPHYFIDREAPEYAGLTKRQYLNAACKRGRDSRREIYDEIFSSIDLGRRVLDYGCGPGWFARELAEHVETVYACDISPGALACARVLNAAANLTYLEATASGLSVIENASLDSVTSLNVIQHLSEENYKKVLALMATKVKPGGRAYLHIQLLDDRWHTEEEWRSDTSLKGRVKYRIGVHCFSLAEERHRDLLKEAGFGDVEIRPVADYTDKNFPDIGDQHILTAVRL